MSKHNIGDLRAYKPNQAAPGFVNPQVPAMKTVKKVNGIVERLIRAANPLLDTNEYGRVSLEDFTASINAAARTITLDLKEPSARKHKFYVDGPITFNYAFNTDDGAMNFQRFVGVVLGFAGVYLEDQATLDSVVEALDPAAFDTSYDEANQTLTITVKATESEFDFTADNATLVTALFPGLSFNIEFHDDIVDITEYFPVTDITIQLTDLVENA